jgi:VWFA-related protein
MHVSRAVLRSSLLRSSLLIVACLGAVCASRLSWTTIAHAEDRATLAFARQQGPSAAPTIQVYSRETIVDVTVTDKDGRPVHGLSKDDFTVKEDGKEQPIKSFAEFGTPSAPAQAPPKLPPNVYTNLQPKAASGATNLLWLDFTNAAPVIALGCCERPYPPTAGAQSLARSMERQRRVQQYAMQYLQNMPIGTRVAVLGTSDPGKLRVLQGLTSDPALLSAAVATMKYDTDAKVWIYSPPIPDPMDKTLESWCSQQAVRNRMTLEALDQIATDAAAIKGRKNLLWFTTGIPSLTDPGYTPVRLSPERCLPDYSADLKKAYGLLAAAQVTVFPIWVRGVPAAADPLFESWPDEKLAMEAVAEATGGKAYYNSNDLADLTAKAMHDGSDYYTLSYVPPGSEYDGRHHSIKVVADKPGLKLTYRDEYYAEDPRTMARTPGLTLAEVPDSAASVDMRAEMGRAMPTSQGLLFDVQVEPSNEAAKAGDPAVFGVLNVKLKGKPLTRYGFTYAFPGREIALKPAADGKQHGSLEFDLAAYDGDGNVVTSLRQAIDLNLTEEQAAQLAHSPFRYFQQLDLPAGALFVRVGVLDRTGNKVGTLELPVTVAKTPQPTAQNTGGR